MNNNDNLRPLDNSNPNPIDDDNGGRTLVWLILGVAAIGCGILFAAAFFLFQPDTKSLANNKYFQSLMATSTPTPNGTATQQSINATKTVLAVQATATHAAGEWREIISEPFDTNKNDFWYVGTDDNEDSKITYQVTDGKYRWAATAHKGFIQWIILTDPVSDFYVSVEGNQVSGTTNETYGVVFREDDAGNYYYFAVKSHNEYSLYQFFNNQWTALIDWTYSPAVASNESNKLTVIAEGDHFILFINNRFVAETHNASIKKGRVDIAILIQEANLQATYEFDNIELRVPNK